MMEKKPDWLKIKINPGENYLSIKEIMRDRSLHTVCEEARCPNIFECWEQRTATFMILGKICTRACRFCAVDTGIPGSPDSQEGERVAEVANVHGLTLCGHHICRRRRLPDGGASPLLIRSRPLRERLPFCRIEVLIPDFAGEITSLQKVVNAQPDVLNHNIETVERLTSRIRSKATYRTIPFHSETGKRNKSKHAYQIGHHGWAGRNLCRTLSGNGRFEKKRGKHSHPRAVFTTRTYFCQS